MHTPSPQSMTQVMPPVIYSSDLGHTQEQAIKTPARGGVTIKRSGVTQASKRLKPEDQRQQGGDLPWHLVPDLKGGLRQRVT